MDCSALVADREKEQTVEVKESKQLLIGTVVTWDDDPTDLGTVREVTPEGVFIDWANGQRGWIDHKDMNRIEIH